MSDRYQSLLAATEVFDPTLVHEDRRRLLALGTAWLVLGALSGASTLMANPATPAALGAIALVCAAVTIRGALGSNHDAAVFALVLPGSLQSVAAVLMVVWSVT